MTDRIPLDELTSDAYDQLWARAERDRAAVERVRAIADQWQAAMRPGEQHPAAHAVRAALDEHQEQP